MRGVWLEGGSGDCFVVWSSFWFVCYAGDKASVQELFVDTRSHLAEEGKRPSAVFGHFCVVVVFLRLKESSFFVEMKEPAVGRLNRHVRLCL